MGVVWALGGIWTGGEHLAAQGSASCPAAPTASESNPISDVRYLADDRLEGRAVGTQGARCAAAFIQERYRELGLPPAYEDHLVPFQVRSGYTLGSHLQLEIDGVAAEVGSDWVPFGFSGTGMIEGDVLTVPAEHIGADLRTGLAHLGAAGRVLFVPSAPERPDVHAFAAAAQAAQAAGVLWSLDALPDPAREARPPVTIPVAAVLPPVAERLTGPTTVTLMTQVERRMAEANNVVAVVPGRHWPDGQVVVVGAHYDHLGLGGEGSLDPDGYGTVHNGADDNASGTAVLLDVGRRLVAGGPLEHSVVLAAFTGEERGLWGSARFVEEPPVPLDRVVAMINMDMVGRLESGGLTVFGVGTAEEWTSILDRVTADLEPPLEYTGAPDGYGPSDHASFYARDIPVLHFFTNTHTEYHRPGDDADRIDGPGLTRISAVVAETVTRLADGAPLTLIRGAGAPAVASSSPDDDPAPSRGYGAYLGSIPDMSGAVDSGVRLTGVREGSPAAAAGIQAGDVLVEMAGREITDLYALTYVLRDHQPGDEIEVAYVRDGERRTVRVTLGRR